MVAQPSKQTKWEISTYKYYKKLTSKAGQHFMLKMYEWEDGSIF